MSLTQWINDGPSRRFAVRAAIAAFIAGSLLAVVAAVAPSIAKAGGLGNFYWAKQCTARSGTLVAKLTNYDSDNYTTQTYHHSGNTAAGYYVNIVLVNDESWPITKDEIWDALSYWGSKSNGYQKFDVAGTQHTYRFYWTDKIHAGYSCSITL
jgi:hypothetical protein